ncbi:hypothetical protein [Hyphomicrobium sp. CS1GBMeth3]|uniref:hypothetical protein n=1 Tax=Hyphomicrobium sp. CS1GBMeth3 TaxID=1892845 RepID=UPI001114BD2A|nr:hypothetical protein [Hyphomicrobium sp. CS1GBMeth3]
MQTWIYVAIAFVGFLMGLMFKVPFVIACSVVLTATIATVAVAGDWPLLSTFGTIAASLFALQTSYLLGVTASSVCHRRRFRK